eukprot:356191-Chlamydomonas_euryale.AAC.10
MQRLLPGQTGRADALCTTHGSRRAPAAPAAAASSEHGGGAAAATGSCWCWRCWALCWCCW